MRNERYDFGDLSIYDDSVWQEIQEENARFEREERIIAFWSVLLGAAGCGLGGHALVLAFQKAEFPDRFDFQHLFY